MKTICCSLTLALLFAASGCFENRKAPHRPVTARSMAEAAGKKAGLERLVLAGQTLDALPQELAAMPKLALLDLRGAQGLQSFAVLPELRALRRLDLAATGLTAVPQEIFKLAWLEHLYLADNTITSLPPAVAGMSALTYLNLDNNRLSAIPAETGRLGALRWLRLNGNLLESLPPELSALSNLQRVYLRQNKLASVPECLKALPLLEDISLSDNPLTAIPDWMTGLPKLRQLDLDGCEKVTKMPADLSGWQKLQVLSLVRCKLPPDEKERVRKALPKVYVAF